MIILRSKHIPEIFLHKSKFKVKILLSAEEEEKGHSVHVESFKNYIDYLVTLA